MATQKAAAAAKEITAEQIAEWKKRYGKVYRYEAADGMTCFLRRPTRAEFSAANVIAGADAIKAKEILLRNCWLDGDMEIQNDDAHFYGIGAWLDDLIGMVAGELKEV